MTESWDDYLAEGTIDSEQLQDLSADLADEAAAPDVPEDAVQDLESAAWSDDAAADFARDGESWDAYGDRAAVEMESHLDKAELAAEAGDDFTAEWEAQQAGFAAETADHAYDRADAADDIADGYSAAADASVEDAAAAGWDPGDSSGMVDDSWSASSGSLDSTSDADLA